MRSALSFGLAAALGIFGVLGIASDARAGNLNLSGTACRNYNAAEVTDIDYFAWGARNINANPRYMVCPLVRSPTTDGSQSLYADLYQYGAQSTTCTVYSYNFNGTFLGSQSFTATTTATGNVDQYVTIAAAQAPYYANLSVLCNVAGAGNVVLMDFDVIQP